MRVQGFELRIRNSTLSLGFGFRVKVLGLLVLP